METVTMSHLIVVINVGFDWTGFLRPDLKENRVANFGLLDQIAALQWIQENIEEFSGDRESVTLMGHGTGAVCVNLLLISPVAQTSGGKDQSLTDRQILDDLSFSYSKLGTWHTSSQTAPSPYMITRRKLKKQK